MIFSPTTYQRNIFLVYLFSGLQYSWFWVSIWVLYYLRFTDYAGIGLLESVMIVTTVLGEIPTGAVADLLGKKYSLTLAFAFAGIGYLVMGFAPSFLVVGVGVMLATIGGVLTSGTTEALLYDSLLEMKQTDRYDKILGNLSSIRMLSLAGASFIGGLLYAVQPGLPFIAVSVFQFLALGTTLLLIEPSIDSEISSWKNYIHQTKQGFWQLFKPGPSRLHNIFIILLTSLIVMNGHVLIDAQLVGLGWSEQALGTIIAVMFVLSAGLGQLTSRLTRLCGRFGAVITAATMIAISMVIVPFLGVLTATAIVMLRNGILEIFGNSANASINATTDSKFRATTLSTYSMLANIPYVLLAFVIGSLMDTYSPHVVTAWIGVGLGVMLVGSVILNTKNTK